MAFGTELRIRIEIDRIRICPSNKTVSDKKIVLFDILLLIFNDDVHLKHWYKNIEKDVRLIIFWLRKQAADPNFF